MEQKQFYYDKTILEFLTVAVQFCALLEQANLTEAKPFIERITKILPLLYLKADLMPEYDPNELLETQSFVTEENYNIVRNNIAVLLGQHDDFLEVFVEDMKYSDKPILATISENLADIYQDVKNFVMFFKIEAQDELIFEAVAKCKENYKFYWGQRCVNVMRPLHELKFISDEMEDEE